MEKAGTEFELSDKELRKLKRVELLEMLLELSRENEDLMLELEEKNRIIEALNLQLENRKIDLKHAGTIAEASFKLNGVLKRRKKPQSNIWKIFSICVKENKIRYRKKEAEERLILPKWKEKADIDQG